MAIMVATALSDRDHGAREVAGVLAHKLCTRVDLVHVASSDVGALQTTLDFVAHEVSRFGVHASWAVLRGEPAAMLAEHARRTEPQLVILVGAEHDQDATFGAVTRSLVTRLQAPLLSVRNAGALMNALMGARPLQVIVATRHFAKADSLLASNLELLGNDVRCEHEVLAIADSMARRRFKQIVEGTQHVAACDLVLIDRDALTGALDDIIVGGCDAMLVAGSSTASRSRRITPDNEQNMESFS
jgi:hypothetical protein